MQQQNFNEQDLIQLSMLNKSHIGNVVLVSSNNLKL